MSLGYLCLNQFKRFVYKRCITCPGKKKKKNIGRKCARVVHLTALKVLVFCDSAEKTLKLVSGAKHTLCYSLLSCYALTSHISYARCYVTMKTAMACGAIG